MVHAWREWTLPPPPPLPPSCPFPCPITSLSGPNSSSSPTATIFRDSGQASLLKTGRVVSAHAYQLEGRLVWSLKMVVVEEVVAGPGKEVTWAARRQQAAIHFADTK